MRHLLLHFILWIINIRQSRIQYVLLLMPLDLADVDQVGRQFLPEANVATPQCRLAFI
jgi:hypothetical protein